MSAGKSTHDDLEISFDWSFEPPAGFDLVSGTPFVVCTDALLVYSSGNGSGNEEVGGNALDRVSDTFCSRMSVSDGGPSLVAGEHANKMRDEFQAGRDPARCGLFELGSLASLCKLLPRSQRFAVSRFKLTTLKVANSTLLREINNEVALTKTAKRARNLYLSAIFLRTFCVRAS